jgi:hypothetical protein
MGEPDDQSHPGSARRTEGGQPGALSVTDPWHAQEPAAQSSADAETTVIYDPERGMYPNLGSLSRPGSEAASAYGSYDEQDGDGWDAAGGISDEAWAREERRIAQYREPDRFEVGPARGDSVLPERRRAVQHTMRRAAGAAMAAGRALARRPRNTPTVISGKGSTGLPADLSPHTAPLLRRSRPVTFFAACLAMLVTALATGVANRGELAANLGARWSSASSNVRILPTPIGGYWMPPVDKSVPAPSSFTNAAHYVQKYGFDWPASGGDISASERARLEVMLPFAIAATARWDARYGDQLEPEMLLFWTHAEGIGARVSYSNCANEGTPAGTGYFTYIANCDTPSFWQLGYGNQFGVISILKTAFTDMRGDPNDAHLVQQVGQAVLDWDRRQGTVPACGGYSCTFPALTLDQIMAGVSLSHETADDWWASVLSRDPAINCYMLARALVWFNHAETKNWVGCYYAEPCWGYESNRMGDILANWNGLLKAAGM